jgi:hypothetical protein
MVDLFDVGHKRGDLDAAQAFYLLADQDIQHAGSFPRARGVERNQARVRIRAAQNRDVEQVRNPHVFDVLPGTNQ